VLKIFKTGIILMVYTLIAGALLASVYIKTAPIIEMNKEAATGDVVRAVVLPGMEGGYVKQDAEIDFPYWTGYRDSRKKEPGGYIFIAMGKGYSSTIETMVGVDINGTITGIKILFQLETPGLGDKIEEIKRGESDPWFTRQFVGKSASDNIALVKDGGEIDGVTGATISSRAVTLSINKGIKRLMGIVSGETFTQIEEPVETAPDTSQVEEETEETPAVITPEEAMPVVLPGMTGGYEKKGGETEFPYWTGYRDSDKTKIGGYVFIARGEGFASTIETLVGVNADGTIAGIKVLSHEEPEGYGDRIEEIREGESDPWFTSQFISKSDNIALTEDGGVIDAISEATISSRAITVSINSGLKQLMDILSGETFTQIEEPVETAPDTSQVEEETEETPTVITPEEAMPVVLPGMDGGYEKKGGETEFPYWTGYRDSGKTEPGGYAFIARGEGFASTIETLVGVNADGTITGVKVLFHEETEGYGNRIEEIRDGESDPWFTRQFIGKSESDNIALTEDGGVIDAISEATISSRAITVSINSGLKQLKKIIGESEK